MDQDFLDGGNKKKALLLLLAHGKALFPMLCLPLVPADCCPAGAAGEVPLLQAPRHKDVWISGGNGPCILRLGGLCVRGNMPQYPWDRNKEKKKGCPPGIEPWLSVIWVVILKILHDCTKFISTYLYSYTWFAGVVRPVVPTLRLVSQPLT